MPELATTETWTDMQDHPLLTKRTEKPLIETRVSKVMKADAGTVFDHFFGSKPELRLDLHKDHVKAYHIHEETDATLEYEYVFEAYGTRNWGKAVEVGDRPRRIDVEVTAGPLTGQTVTTLFDVLPALDDGTPQTKVTQVNRVWPGDADMTVRIMGRKLQSQLAALAGVHLEQHRVDIETDGQERFQDRFSQEHQAEVEEKKRRPVKDFLATTRAVALPTVALPLVAAAGLAAAQGTFSPLALVLTLLGGGAALLAANLVNDLYDFKGGADQSARTVPGQIETGSGAFTEGRWSQRKGWFVTLWLSLVALGSGVALAILSTPLVLAYAVGGAAIAFFYVGPPFPLAYKGRGLGELAILAAFGFLPVLGAVLAHGGAITAQVWWLGGIYGGTSILMLYHHHFLHWEADRLAGKGSPIALMGPRVGAGVGMVLALATGGAIANAVWLGHLPSWAYATAVLPVLFLWPPQIHVLRGAVDAPDRVKVATGAFFAMTVTGIAVAVAAWMA